MTVLNYRPMSLKARKLNRTISRTLSRKVGAKNRDILMECIYKARSDVLLEVEDTLSRKTWYLQEMIQCP